MAGAGYKLFATGDVLTAAQVNTYLMQQTVMVFASSAARTTALSGVLAEGMVSYLQDTNSLEVYDGSAWIGATGDITALTAGTGISISSATGPIPTVAIDSTVATLTGSQTLTNKTLTSPIISTISNTGTLTLPTSTDTIVGRATTDTLTNKTLTSPVISTISNTGTLTLPTSTDTLIGRATTDTLTNKTLTSPVLTTPTISTATTNGDILYGTGSGALARLGIGSSGQVLSVSGGVPAWASASAGATNWTLLNSGGTALTGAAKITVSFTAPKQIMVIMVGASSANSRSFITLRPNDNSAADYSVGGILLQPSNETSNSGVGGYSNYTSISFGTMSNASNSTVSGSFYMNMTDLTGWKNYSVTSGGDSNGTSQGAQLFALQGIYESSSAITSIAVLSSDGNFDAGTIYVLGAN